MLNIKNLKVSVENKLILNDLNLKINPGEVHAIMGPNGSGKSTLANVLSGKKGYEIQGEILFDKLSINDIAVEERAQKGNIFSLSNIPWKFLVLIQMFFYEHL